MVQLPHDRSASDGLSRRRLLGLAAGVGAVAPITALAGGCNQQRSAQTEAGRRAQEGQVGPGGQYPEEAARALNDSLTWPETAIPEPGQQVSITVAHAWDATFLQRQEQFDRFFMERHPTISVTRENTPFADFQQKYVTAAAGGSLPDLMYMHFSWIQTFIRQGVFLDLSDYLARQPDFDADDFTAPSTVPFIADNRQYAVPYDCGPLMLYYNRDLLSASGIGDPDDSWTTDDLKEAALEIAGAGGGQVWGMAGGPSPTSPDLAPPWLFPHGGRFVNETQTACVLDEPGGQEAMAFWFDLVRRGAVPTQAQAANVEPDPFVAGRAGFQLNGTWGTPQLQSLSSFEWAMAKWPEGPQGRFTAAEGSGYAITQDSDQRDAAWIYLNEFTSQAGQNFMWASTGRGSPSRSSAWQFYVDSDLAAPGADTILPTLEEFSSADILFLPQTTEALNAAQPIWDRVVAQRLELADGLQQISSAMTPILARNAR